MEPKEPQRTEILTRLMNLSKKSGGAVWCSGRLPSVRLLPYGEPEVLTWRDAAILTEVEIEGEEVMQKGIREKIRKAKMKVIEKRGMGVARNAEWVSDEEMDRRAIALDRKKA